MAAPIRFASPPTTPPSMPCTTQGAGRQESFSQAISQTIMADIHLQTAEGDTVTISGVNRYQEVLAGKSVRTPTSTSTELLMTSARQSGLALAVQGNLSEEEISDIRDLMADLTSISSSFFAGDHQGAMEQAASLGDMGSITSLSASFSRQSSIRQTLTTSGHPLPNTMEGMARLQSLAQELPKSTEDYGEWLRARWQELLETFHTTEDSSSPPPSSSSPEETASRMAERLQHTFSQHPRLTPFAEPLADRAMRKGVLAAAPPDTDYAATIDAFRSLRESFMDQWQQWLHGAPEAADHSAGNKSTSA